MFYTVVIYASLVVLGGIMGYLKAGSTPSLIASTASGALLYLAALGLYLRRRWAAPLALIVVVILDLFFTYRFLVTFKLFPAGILALTTLIVLVVIIRQLRKVN